MNFHTTVCFLIGFLLCAECQLDKIPNVNSKSNNVSDAQMRKAGFPQENIPKNPTKIASSSTNSEEDSKPALTTNQQQIIIATEIPQPSKNLEQEKIFSFQIPINENEEPLELEQKETPEASDNIISDEQIDRESHKKENKLRNVNKREHIYGNDSQIQGADSGFLQLAHPDHNAVYHTDYQNEQQVQQFYPEVIGEIQQQPILFQQQQHYHNTPGDGYPQHQLHPQYHHLEHKEIPKPLKPSIVHRDPYDFYSHLDKVRTLDKDHDHHNNEHKQLHNNKYGRGSHYLQEPHHPPHSFEQLRFNPYDYDMKKVPECAHKNKYFYNLTFCLEDHLYPTETILWALHQQGYFAEKSLSDVTYQSADNLVSGLTRTEEEGYTYKHYFGASHSQHTNLEMYKPPYHGYTYKTDYFKKGGYICPSDIYYGRPKRAMNTYGKWKVIVNIDHIPKKHHHIEEYRYQKKREINFHHLKGQEIVPKTQTLRLEQCIYPEAPCSYISPYFHSRCIQKHNFVRLVAWNMEQGIHVDTFKLPIACSCHIPQPIHFFEESGHREERNGHDANHYVHND